MIFSDISADLLEFCREAATELGVLDRCRFAEATADDLGAIDDESVDVVTTRSVLIYVKEKGRALAEFARVLRPGGRISLWEPINRFGSNERRDAGFVGYPTNGLAEITSKLHAIYDAIQPPDSDPMLDFDERDLLLLAEETGFSPIRVTLDARIESSEPRSWDGFLDTAWNPNVPTLREAIEEALSPDEREQLTVQLRPLVERGEGEWRMAFALLSAVQP